MPRYFNHCVYNHPCPIYCSSNLACQGGNNIVNPIVPNHQYGYFNNLNVGQISADAIIPVTLDLGLGTAITESTTTTGAITLLAGEYEVSYFAEGTIPAGGTMAIKLQLNNTDIPNTTLTSTQTVGNVVNLFQTIFITVPQTSTLKLVNAGTEETTFAGASVAIHKL